MRVRVLVSSRLHTLVLGTVRCSLVVTKKRAASHGWQEEYTRRLVELGFRSGEASPCCFHRASDDISCVMHGDDFTFEGPPEGLRKVAEALEQFWLIKIRATLGPEEQDDKEVSILNRIVRWSED